MQPVAVNEPAGGLVLVVPGKAEAELADIA